MSQPPRHFYEEFQWVEVEMNVWLRLRVQWLLRCEGCLTLDVTPQQVRDFVLTDPTFKPPAVVSWVVPGQPPSLPPAFNAPSPEQPWSFKAKPPKAPPPMYSMLSDPSASFSTPAIIVASELPAIA
jgi:hypothetical protein